MFAEALKLVFPAFGTAHSHDSNDVFSIVKASRLASRASSLGQQQDQQDQQGQQGPHADEGDDWGTSSQTEAKPSLDRELAVADLVHLLRALRKDEGKRALRRVVASLLDAGTLFASYWLYTLGGDEEDNLLESAGMCKMRIAEAAFESFLRRFSPEAAVTFMEPLRGMHGSLVQFSRDHMDAMVLVGTLLRIGIQGDVPLRDAFERQVETAALALREALALLEADLCGTRDDGVQVALQDHARTLYENLGDLWKAIDTDEDVKGIRAAFSGLMKALFVNDRDGNVAFKPELLADFTDLVVPVRAFIAALYSRL
ncbi:hypothetical protein BC830DRAFT_263648 [Chytriomyces sp. MP71]|nr:hypothetical protein BC830DRAFT_263648 [Chytriomyces sp. MP71]